MSPQFRKEAILQGLIDAYCLVCDEHLRDDSEVAAHIAKPVHSKTLKAAEFVLNPYDSVLKVKHGYFCIICGLFLATIAKTRLHVKEKQHYRRRAVQGIERVAGYVSVDNLLIDYKAWSGLMDNSCAVCNVEVSCQDLHKSQPSHIMNLIHSEVVFGHEMTYRKVDESSFHCITCNELCSFDDISTHFEDAEHKRKWYRCQRDQAWHDFRQGKLKFSCNCRKFKPVTFNCDLNNEKSTTANHSTLSNHLEHEKCTITNNCTLNNNLEHGKHSTTSNSNNSEDFDSDVSDCPSEEFADALDLREHNKIIIQQTILDSVATFEKNEVNINFENETAFCKKCFVHTNFDHNAILSHIEEHDRNGYRRNCSYVPFPCEVNMKNNAQTSSEPESRQFSNAKDTFAILGVISDQKDEKNVKVEQTQNPVQSDTKKYCNEDRAAFANQNQLEYKENNNKVYCRICKVMLPYSIASMVEHVAGNVHKKLATKYVAPPDPIFYRKTSMEDFISELMTIRNYAGKERVVNGKYCLDGLSFLMITRTGLTLRCQVCEENLTSDQVELHEETWYHRQSMKSTPVVTSLVDKTEFVREVRPGIFHCGYCNMVIAPWADLQNHLKSNEHKTVKDHYSSRMRRLRPEFEIVRQRHRLEMEMRANRGRFGFGF